MSYGRGKQSSEKLTAQGHIRGTAEIQTDIYSQAHALTSSLLCRTQDWSPQTGINQLPQPHAGHGKDGDPSWPVGLSAASMAGRLSPALAQLPSCILSAVIAV